MFSWVLGQPVVPKNGSWKIKTISTIFKNIQYHCSQYWINNGYVHYTDIYHAYTLSEPSPKLSTEICGLPQQQFYNHGKII